MGVGSQTGQNMKHMICNRCREKFKKRNGCKIELSIKNSRNDPDIDAHLCYSCYKDILDKYMEMYD